MPVMSHWNHPSSDKVRNPVEETVDVFHHSPCRKGESQQTIKSNKVENHNQKYIFCEHNSEVELNLVAMHGIQRAGNKYIQKDIDRHLVMCMDVRFGELILPRNCVPHYDNLPDMFKYVVGILDPQMDSIDGLQQVLLLLRQCLPLRRRTKRAQREVKWKLESMASMQTLIRCTQGILLGLYPTSLQNIAFNARMGIFTFLRTLLVQPFEILQLVMQKIPYIIKLGVMEHICNLIWDYYPGIRHTLNQSGQTVEHFCNSVSSICDIFRSELNSLFCVNFEKFSKLKEKRIEQMEYVGGKHEKMMHSRVFLSILYSLEKIAHSYFERCTRAYRGIIIGHDVQQKPIDLAKRMLSNPLVVSNIGLILDTINFSQYKNVFEMVHFTVLGGDSLLVEFAWLLTRIVHVMTLPVSVIQNQLNALSIRYGGDTYCMERCRILHICILCAIRKGGAHGMKLRHDCQTGEILCINCGKMPVLSIDMIGRIVCIGNDTIIMSSCCATFIHYSGIGTDFSTQCGIHCSHSGQLFRKKQRTNAHTSLGILDEGCKNDNGNNNNSMLFMEDESFSPNTAVIPKINKKKKTAWSMHAPCIPDQSPSIITPTPTSTTSVPFKFHYLRRHSDNHHQQGRDLQQFNQQQRSNKSICEICGLKNIYQTFHLLDVDSRSMVNCSLCSKHVIPQYLSTSILNKTDVISFFKNCISSHQTKLKDSGLSSPHFSTAKSSRKPILSSQHKQNKNRTQRKTSLLKDPTTSATNTSSTSCSAVTHDMIFKRRRGRKKKNTQQD